MEHADTLSELSNLLPKLKNSAIGFHRNSDNVIKHIENLIKEINEDNTKFNIAKIAGSTAGVVGGVVSAVGFGLAFVTAGASITLCAAGSYRLQNVYNSLLMIFTDQMKKKKKIKFPILKGVKVH